MCGCQQYELYAAERGVPQGRSFLSGKTLQEWVDSLRDNSWWERNFSNVLRVEVNLKPSGSCSVGGFYADNQCGVIDMLPVHRTPLYVLHELSHVLADARFGSHSHDPWFARIYLEAVYVYLGSETYKTLHDAFVAHGIDFGAAEFMNPGGITL